MIEELRSRVNQPNSRALAQAVSEAIRDGAVVGGDLLPPIREVAREFNISPSTVGAAWAVLARAGLIHADGRRGTRIVERAPIGPARFRNATQFFPDFEINLSTGLPDPELLPDIKPALQRLHEAGPLQTYLPQPVLPELEERLHATFPFAADVITVADGAMDALDLIVTTFLRFGDKVAVEEYTDPPLLDLLESEGINVIPVALDRNGPKTESLREALEAGASTVFLQPRAQRPTGFSIAEERAHELATVLEVADAQLVEIDLAGDIASASNRSLGTHIPHRTLHVRGFSTSHGPDLRLASIGGPASRMEALIQRRHLGQGWTSRLLQMLLLDLLNDPACEARILAARDEYARRREGLRDALEHRGVAVLGGDGLYLWIPVVSDSTALVTLTSEGIGAAPGTPYSVSRGAKPHLCVTAGLCKPEDVELVADAIARAAQPPTIGRQFAGRVPTSTRRAAARTSG